MGDVTPHTYYKSYILQMFFLHTALQHLSFIHVYTYNHSFFHLKHHCTQYSTLDKYMVDTR